MGCYRLSGVPPRTGGTTVRHGPNLTPRGAPERSESSGIRACQGPKDYRIVNVRALSPDRGSLRRQRTWQHERRATASDGGLRSDHAGTPRYSESDYLNLQRVLTRTKKRNETPSSELQKARRPDEVIYNTKLGNVYLISANYNYNEDNFITWCEVRELSLIHI